MCELPPLKTSQSAITPGFDLKAKYIIHTVGPVYNEDASTESVVKLQECYTNVFKLALKNNIKSIAFPLISSGAFGFPKDKALQIARETIAGFLTEYDLDVTLTVFDKESFFVSKNLIGEVESYINENYVDEFTAKESRRPTVDTMFEFGEIENADCKSTLNESSIDDVLENLDEPFSVKLLKLIDEKGKTDVEVYKKANIDRKLFSKIRTGKGYSPSKKTILALSISLELTLDETNDLLERAGFTLSHSQKFDVIIEFFIKRRLYDIFDINEVLLKYDQVLLGGQ